LKFEFGKEEKIKENKIKENRENTTWAGCYQFGPFPPLTPAWPINLCVVQCECADLWATPVIRSPCTLHLLHWLVDPRVSSLPSNSLCENGGRAVGVEFVQALQPTTVSTIKRGAQNPSRTSYPRSHLEPHQGAPTVLKSPHGRSVCAVAIDHPLLHRSSPVKPIRVHGWPTTFVTL
jgi:hypothetical protein